MGSMRIGTRSRISCQVTFVGPLEAVVQQQQADVGVLKHAQRQRPRRHCRPGGQHGRAVGSQPRNAASSLIAHLKKTVCGTCSRRTTSLPLSVKKRWKAATSNIHWSRESVAVMVDNGNSGKI